MFKKGKQREFLDLTIKKLNCVSLRGLLQFGFKISYSSLKNYYIGRRLLPKSLFDSLCYLARINKKAKIINGNWGQVKGGRNRLS